MLPFKKPRGQEAYKRVLVFVNDVDRDRYKNLTVHEIQDVGMERLNSKFIKLETLSERFGWKNYEES